MTTRRSATAATAAFTLSGILFFLYPALRPWTDETTLDGAEAMASTSWVAAHTAGILGFILLIAAMAALAFLAPVAARRPAFLAAISTWLGASLVLPYYGVEAFGAQVIGGRAVEDGDATMLTMVEDFRYGPVAVTMFTFGLLLLAVAGIAVAFALWNQGTLARTAGLLLATGLVLYLPQFFGTPAMRIVHGLMLGLGCLALAAFTWRSRIPAAETSSAGRVVRAA
ncbi:MAG: hypothetical protein M3Q98_06230 [Actinomycetota bacterium]|nr:hypothetical protein [Actinomycetota bacterium]